MFTSKPVRPFSRFTCRRGEALPETERSRGRADIVLLGMNFPPEPTGIGPYTGALAKGLGEAGYNVEAFVAHPHYPEWSIHHGYGQWTRDEAYGQVRVRRRLHYVPKRPRGARRLLSELSFGARIVFARWGRPRVVIAVSPSLFSTALAALRLRISPRRTPFVLWIQDIYTLGVTETGEGADVVRRVTKWVEARTARAADRVVVIHDRFAQFVVQDLKVLPSRVVVLRNWTHLPPSTAVDSTTAKAALGWPPGVTLAVHTGNMGVKQGLENIVEAARIADERHAPVHFILVGDGGEARKLKDDARGVSKLTFVDPLQQAQYRLALCAADVLLVNERPGVAEMAVPSKLTSYFDAGRPVVAATDINGITASEVRAANAGLVVPAGHAEALLDAVLELRADLPTAKRFGTNGRRYREDVLDQRAALQQWTSLVASMASNYEC